MRSSSSGRRSRWLSIASLGIKGVGVLVAICLAVCGTIGLSTWLGLHLLEWAAQALRQNHSFGITRETQLTLSIICFAFPITMALIYLAHKIIKRRISRPRD